MSLVSLRTTAGATVGFIHLNYVIALCVLGAIYLFEIYLIVTNKNTKPKYEYFSTTNTSNCYKNEGHNFKKEYIKYYGSNVGWLFYNIDKHMFGLADKLSSTPSDGKLNKYWYYIKTSLKNIVYVAVKLLVKVFKLLVHAVTSRMLTTTVVTAILWYLYANYIQNQTNLFVDNQLPEILLNIFGSNVYKDNVFEDIPEAPQTIDKNLGNMDSNYYIKDFYINSCHRPYIIGDDKSAPTTAAFSYIINAGARYLTFDIFEDLVSSVDTDGVSSSIYTPMVRTMYHYKKTDQLKSISFADMMRDLAGTKPFSQNKTYPLILHLNMWSHNGDTVEKDKQTPFITSGFQHQSTYVSIHNTLLKYFKPQYGLRGSTPAGYGGDRGDNTSLGDIKIEDCNNRLLLVSNSQTQYIPPNITIHDYTIMIDNNKAIIVPYIYGTVNIWIPESCIYTGGTINDTLTDNTTHPFDYTRDMLKGGIRDRDMNKQEMVDTNKKGCGIIIPRDCITIFNPGHPLFIPRANTYNPVVLDCMNMGYQIILINYQYMGQELENYLQVFKQTSFILKPAVLRLSHIHSKPSTQQTALVSFAMKSVESKGVLDEPILF